jgi:hypothetical protein
VFEVQVFETSVTNEICIHEEIKSRQNSDITPCSSESHVLTHLKMQQIKQRTFKLKKVGSDRRLEKLRVEELRICTLHQIILE